MVSKGFWGRRGQKKFSNAQTSGEFVKFCSNFSPVDVSGAGTEAKSSGEELSFVISEGDV